MITQVVDYGDTHFKHGHWRNAARVKAQRQILAAGKALPHLGAWIHNGDLFDGDADEDDIWFAADTFQEMADVAPVLAITGNHGVDAYTRLMSRLSAAHRIQVIDTPRVVTVDCVTGARLHVACLPYPHKAQLVALGLAPGEIRHAAEQAMDVVCASLADELVFVADGSAARANHRMVVGHLTVTGVEASTGQPMGYDRNIAIAASSLARFGRVPILMGHIHHPQVYQGIYIVGSTAAANFGESERKQWALVEFEADDWRVISQPIETPRLFHVEGDLSRDGFTWEVKKGPGGPKDDPPEPDWTGCEVKVIASHASEERSVLDAAKATIEAQFPGASKVVIEHVAYSVRHARAPELATVHTLYEKLQIMARMSDVTWSGHIDRCAQELQATPDLDRLSAAVEARMATLVNLDSPAGEVVNA